MGRPSNNSGADKLAELLRDLAAGPEVVILGENDCRPDGEWSGRDGARSVAAKLRAALPGVGITVMMPPRKAKDAREFLTDPAREGTNWAERGAAFAAALKPDAAEAPTRATPKPPAPPRAHLDPGIGLAELMKVEFAPLRLVVAGVLPEGLTVLAGGIKEGKSWLAYQVAIAAGGYPCLGGRQTARSPVLGLFLEDNRRRLQSRAKRLLEAYEWAPPEGVTLRCRSHTSAAGGLEDIDDWLAANKGGLVVIDTLQRFRSPKRGQDGAYADDYAAMGALHEVVHGRGGSALVLHHTRKMWSDDPFERISGTQGVAGAADTMLILDRNGAEGNLWVRGRDLAEVTFGLAYDGGLWAITSEDEGVVRTERPVGAVGPPRPGPKPAARDEAREWLRGVLAEGPAERADLLRRAKVAGHAEQCVERAANELKVVREVRGFPARAVWSLPEPPAPVRGEPGTAGTPGTTEAQTPENVAPAQSCRNSAGLPGDPAQQGDYGPEFGVDDRPCEPTGAGR